ncbi:hypothetical protein L2E82_33108 [Cichorium intybus]|uniref:Uncharacterized protein n=1 Tax=Cichorium intybus TaxID=13427 RepID=A0ACB9BJ98_CICIN|nr:hypothetical protein L2E82_33108 [Cichorium intybus]
MPSTSKFHLGSSDLPTVQSFNRGITNANIPMFHYEALLSNAYNFFAVNAIEILTSIMLPFLKPLKYEYMIAIARSLHHSEKEKELEEL